jgi:hypothetical protein
MNSVTPKATAQYYLMWVCQTSNLLKQCYSIQKKKYLFLPGIIKNYKKIFLSHYSIKTIFEYRKLGTRH